ncbi:MAG: hypothetical protein IKI66_00255 [Bacteroidales bacterium]|nr:hypothetical protein [Bacteroidales bacterium]
MSRNNTKVDAAFAKANELIRNAKSEPSSVLQESGVFFIGWFSLLLSLDPSNFIIASIAILCNLFFGVDVATWGLPVTIERAIENFVPTILKNRENRKNGVKGGQYGVLGHQKKKEKNPAGVNGPTPGGVKPLNPYDNDIEHVNEAEKVKEDDDGDEVVYISESDLQQQYGYLYPIFFFKNFKAPFKQLQRFVDHYSARGWTMSGGDTATSREARISLARTWKDTTDPCQRYQKEDLDMWYSLFSVAPGPIKEKMLHKYVLFTSSKDEKLITCPDAVIKWIKSTTDAIQIIDKWRHEIPIQFKTTESLLK